MSWVEDPGWSEIRGLRLSDLQVDQAYVNVTSNSNPLWLYTLSDDCYKCPFYRHGPVPDILTVSTKHRTTWRLLLDGSAEIVPIGNTSGLVCELSPRLGQFGVYDLSVNGNECSFSIIREPVNIYLPLVLCFLGIVLIWIICSLGSRGVKVWEDHKKRVILPTSAQQVGDPNKGIQTNPSRGQRLKSLDTFRGISIVLMIFVNYGAGQYWFFEHATWNGLQLADLLFPWFLWIMGVCIPISMKSQLKRGIPRWGIFCGVLRRSMILFLLGLILNTLGAGARLETIRLFGVLQRFGVTYLIVATLNMIFTCRSYSIPKISLVSATQDLLVLLPQWLLMLALVAGHCALVFLLEVPNCPSGYLGPGGIQDNGKFKHCIGGATGYIDSLVLGTNHLYQKSTVSSVYYSGNFDPEGLVGCMLSVFQVFLGVQAGTILSFHREWQQRLTRWLVWGTLCGITGGLLCLGSKEDGWIPINKNLWSLSFVLVTSSFAFYLLAACYILIDVKKWWTGTPFFYPGMNATIMYVGHSVAYNLFPWHWALGPMNTHFILLLECLWGSGLWILVAVWLFRIKFFFSI